MEKVRRAIDNAQNKINLLSDSEKKALEETVKLTPEEYMVYQQSKSIAQAEGKIDVETSLFIYNSLRTWSKMDLATKVILIQIFAMFLGYKLKK
jgi:hypothetical protein